MATLAVVAWSHDFRIGQTTGTVEFFQGPGRLQATPKQTLIGARYLAGRRPRGPCLLVVGAFDDSRCKAFREVPRTCFRSLGTPDKINAAQNDVRFLPRGSFEVRSLMRW